ncbi:MAG: bifunctional adenosylcobinamide kinase/adenosylcobinamide-phosphate guanylyltransferase [Eubacteriales bacterium]
MVVFIIGGSASGKSEYAENLSVRLAQEAPKLYIATMEPFGEEAKYRIERHHALRKNKGFHTLERYRNLKEIKEEGYHTILLECMSTLLANERFAEEKNKGNYVESILRGIETLKSRSEHLILVSNKIFDDGVEYADETKGYIKDLGEINRRLSQDADVVIEIVCGIPVIHKGQEKLNGEIKTNV